MALTYVGGNSNTGTGATISVSLTALTGGSNSSPSAGDVVVVFFGVGCDANFTATLSEQSGNYTHFGTQSRGNDANDAVCRGAYRIQPATPDTSVTVSGPNNSGYSGWAAVQVWRGVDSSTPLTGTASGTSGTNGNHGDPGAITPSVNDAVVLCGYSGAAAANVGDSKTGPTNYTTYEVKGTATDGTGADCYFAISSRLLSGGSGSSENPGAYSGGTTSASDAWATWTAAIAPQGAVAGNVSQASPVSADAAALVPTVAGVQNANVAQASPVSATAAVITTDATIEVTLGADDAAASAETLVPTATGGSTTTGDVAQASPVSANAVVITTDATIEVTLGADKATSTAETLVPSDVSVQSGVTVNQPAPVSATAAVPAPDVTVTGVIGAVTAAASGLALAASLTVAAFISAATATASAAIPTPTITGAVTGSVSQPSPVSGTGAVLIPSVTGIVAGSVSQASPVSATGAVLVPGVGGVATVSQASPVAATGAVPAPSVASGSTITAATATAMAGAYERLPVQWPVHANYSSTSDGTLTRTAASGMSGVVIGPASSLFVEATATATDKAMLIGLSHDNPGEDIEAVDYEIRLGNDGIARQYENTSFIGSLGSYQVGDVFRIESHTLGLGPRYLKNGQHIATSNTNATLPLMVVGWIFDQNASLGQVTYGSSAPAVTVAPTVSAVVATATAAVPTPGVEGVIAWYLVDYFDSAQTYTGTASDTRFDDGSEAVFDEAAVTPGFAIDLWFGSGGQGVPTPTLQFNLKGWYEGNPAHNVKLQEYNWNTTSWVDVTAETNDFPSAASEQTYAFALINNANYVSAQNYVGVRIVHTSPGNPAHNFHIDRAWLSAEIAGNVSGQLATATAAIPAPDVTGAAVGGSVATATASAGVPDLSVAASLDGAVATATAEVLVPTAGVGIVNVSAVTATATAVVIDTAATIAAVLGADKATASAAALVPTVDVGTVGSVDQASPVSATAEVLVPVVTGSGVYVDAVTATASAVVITTDATITVNLYADIAAATGAVLPGSVPMSANVSAVIATATAEVVDGGANLAPNVEQDSAASATGAVNVPEVSPGASVTGDVAEATAEVLIPSVYGVVLASVSGEIAAASGTVLTPGVGGGAGAQIAFATAAVLVPGVEGRTVSGVSGVVAEATGAVLVPTLTNSASVQPSVATASAAVLTPSVSSTGSVASTVATASGAVLTPGVTGGATVSPSVALATAFTPYPTVSATNTNEAAAATANGEVLIPTVTAIAVSSISAVPATASAIVQLTGVTGVTEVFLLPEVVARGIAAYDVLPNGTV